MESKRTFATIFIFIFIFQLRQYMWWMLFEIGIVWEDVDEILNHPVAEVVLLLEGETRGELSLPASAVYVQKTFPGSTDAEKLSVFRTADLTLSLFPPTTVWTMCGLCVRKLLTVWKTSRRPSAFTLSRMLLRAMKVPVRPAPALKQKHENWHKEDPGLPSKGKKKYGCCPAALHNRAADRSSALFFFCLNGKVCKRKGDLCVIAIIITLT